MGRSRSSNLWVGTPFSCFPARLVWYKTAFRAVRSQEPNSAPKSNSDFLLQRKIIFQWAVLAVRICGWARLSLVFLPALCGTKRHFALSARKSRTAHQRAILIFSSRGRSFFNGPFSQFESAGGHAFFLFSCPPCV